MSLWHCPDHGLTGPRMCCGRSQRVVQVEHDRPLQQFDRIKGRFVPRRTDDLTEGARAAIGWYGEWEVVWIIEEGQFSGEWAMAPRSPAPLPDFAWVPSGDIQP